MEILNELKLALAKISHFQMEEQKNNDAKADLLLNINKLGDSLSLTNLSKGKL